MTSFHNRLHPSASATARTLTPAKAETPSGPETTAPVERPPGDHSQPPSFATLPPEIHILISKQLTYPDALSLKHTNRYFYNLVGTGVKLKVDWLVERRLLHLECPNHGCDLGSDLRFCRGSIRCVPLPNTHLMKEYRSYILQFVDATTTRTHRVRVSAWSRVSCLRH